MTTKQISDLNSITATTNSDLLLVRQAATGTDSKINVANFAKSIGSSSVVGFTAVNTAGVIVLTSSNGSLVSEYKDGMVIGFKSPIDNTNGDIKTIKIGTLLAKDLYTYNTTAGTKFGIDDYIEAVYFNGAFQRLKEEFKISDIEEVADVNDNDYIRVTVDNVEKKVKFSDMIESIGETAVFGFTAASIGTANAPVFQLTSSNTGKIKTYRNGMKIHFRAPVQNSDANNQTGIKIGDLAITYLYKYNSSDNVVYKETDYIEAIYVDNNFYQVNDFSNVIFCSDYRVINYTTDIIDGITYTSLQINSAYGSQKKEYYNGMQIGFVCPVDTTGTVVRLAVDGLAWVPLMDTLDGQISNILVSELYEHQFVQAVLIKTPLSIFKRNTYNLNDVRKQASPSLSITYDEEGGVENINIDKTVMQQKTIVHDNSETLQKRIENILKDPNYPNNQYTIDVQVELQGLGNSSLYFTDCDLSNITLCNTVTNTITLRAVESDHSRHWLALVAQQKPCGGFNIKEGTVINIIDNFNNYHFGTFFTNGNNFSRFSFKNITFQYSGSSNKGIRFLAADSPRGASRADISIETCTFSSVRNAEFLLLYTTIASTVTIKNVTVTNTTAVGVKQPLIFLYTKSSQSSFYIDNIVTSENAPILDAPEYINTYLVHASNLDDQYIYTTYNISGVRANFPVRVNRSSSAGNWYYHAN